MSSETGSKRHESIMAVTIPLAAVAIAAVLMFGATRCNEKRNQCTMACVEKGADADAIRVCLKGCTSNP